MVFAATQSAVNVGISLDEMVGLPPDIRLYNGGTRCDLMFGPCNCGAWHHEDDTYNVDAIKRQYLYFLIVEKDNGKSRI